MKNGVKSDNNFRSLHTLLNLIEDCEKEGKRERETKKIGSVKLVLLYKMSRLKM